MDSAQNRPRGLVPLAAFYFGYYAAIGIQLPFLPQHLRGLGLSGAELGLVSAASPVMALLSPPLWGFLADRSRRAALLLTLGAAGQAIALMPLLTVTTLEQLAPVMLLAALFSAPLPMLADSLTLQQVGANGAAYARVRLFGSVGFICSSTLFGLVWTGTIDFPPPVIVALIGCALLGLGASLAVRGSGEQHPAPSLRDALGLLGDTRVSLLVASTALHWLACAPYHLLFGVHVQELRLPPAIAGLGMGIGVAAEVVVMLAYPRFLARLGPVRILAIAYAASSIRWMLVGVVDSPAALVLLQILHGLTFGAFLLAGVTWLAQIVPARLRATGQALFTSITYGVGGIAGYLLAGRLYESWGSRQVFVAGAVLEWLPLALVLLLGRQAPRVRVQC